MPFPQYLSASLLSKNWALLGSVGIHLFLLIMIFHHSTSKKNHFTTTPSLQPSNQPFRLTITSAAPSPPPPQFVDSSQGIIQEHSPHPNSFESDQSTVAQSSAIPDQHSPLPAIAGHPEEGHDLHDQPFTPGQAKVLSTFAPTSHPSAPPIPSQPPPHNTPQPQPSALPSPQALIANVSLKPSNPVLAFASPPPSPPTFIPKPTPQPSPPEVTPHIAKALPLSPAQNTHPTAPAFQPERRATRLEGGLSNRGQASLESQATPLGKYRKQLSDAIGVRWYTYVNAMLDLITIGSVNLKFLISSDGSVHQIQILSNTSNSSLATCSIRSITEATIPPIPDALLPILQNEQLEVEYSFTVLSP